MIIPEKVKSLFEKQGLIAFGTADRDSVPNVVPIFWKKILNEETIILIDNYMKMTKKNLIENDNVCISFWDPDTKEAYKLIGKAKYHTEGQIYEEGKKFIQIKKPDNVPKGVVEITLSDIYIITPGSDAGKKI